MTDVAASDEDGDIATAHEPWVQRRLADASGRVAATQLVCRPDRLSRVLAAIPAPEGRSLIARGGGQSFGDAALNDGGAIALIGRLDRMLSFDPASGILVAEAGVTVGDIQRTFLPRGYALAVCPGSSRTTLGGAVAADVHGMNHVRDGAFGAHVQWLDLVTAHGGLRRISPQGQPDLFDATIGGMGLTGIVVRAAIRLRSAPSRFVDVRREAFVSLESLLDALTTGADTRAYATAWIDAAAVGANLGRGVLETADPAPPDRRVPALLDAFERRGWPGRLGRLAGRDAIRFGLTDLRRRGRHTGRRTDLLPLVRFLFEDEFLASMPAVFRKRDHVRFHCVMPPDDVAAGIRRLLDVARRSGGIAYASLRAMGKQGRGLVSFPHPGVSLALDLPARVATPDLMRRLERETLDRGGRVYLACDVHLTDHGFAAMYPRLPALRDVLLRVDPQMRLQSDLARRLRLRDYVV